MAYKEEMVRYSNMLEWVDVCKGWEEEVLSWITESLKM